MYSRIGISLASGLLAAVLMTGSQIEAANDNVPEEAEVLGRGPIHEAFAQPLEEGQAGPVAPKAPPEPIEEQAPEQRPEGDDVQWIPGYWQWDDERGEFLWVSGLWRNPPPNRKWVPGSWRETDQGFEWSNGFWAPESAEDLQYLPPPPATVEEGPSVEAPGEDYNYVPGLWVYRDARYAWRPGYWLQCRPDWVWQNAHYVHCSAGYLYVPGCWDYPLDRRGILFAPAYFSGGLYPRFWRPRLALSIDCLLGSLFVRGGHRHYYYGDYFTAGYRRGGFTPWGDYRYNRHGYDPLFGHYRSGNAGRSWERETRGLYADRFAGRAARPPRNLTQQNLVTKNVTNVTNIKNLTVLRPLAQSAPARSQLVTVNQTERNLQHQRAVQLRSAGVQRAKAERELIVKKEAPSRTQTAPKKVTIDLPKSYRPNQQGERRTQPSPAQRFEGPKNTPKFEAPKNTPRFEAPKTTPKFEAPKNKPKFDAPKTTPKFEAPKNKPKFDAPKTTPKFEAPKNTPRFEAPKNTPKFEAPKNKPKFEAPKTTPKFEAPKNKPKFEAPKTTPKFEAPKTTPRFETPKPVQQFKPAPSKPVQQFKPAPSKPVQQFRQAPSKPAQQFRQAPSKPAQQFRQAPSRPAQSGKPRR